MSERFHDIAKILKEAEQVVQDVKEHSVEEGNEKALDRLFAPLFHPDYSKVTQEITESKNRMAFRQIFMGLQEG